jgi:RNA methyltransferase, TrmH family
MLSQNKIKLIASLQQKKFRQELGLFVAEGHKLVTDLIGSRLRLEGIYATTEWITANRAPGGNDTCSLTEVTPREMARISGLSTPGQVLAVVHTPQSIADPAAVSELATSELILALDEIRDPGNLGTIIRIADWFGIGTILLSESSVDTYNPKVVQATMGSIARVRVTEGDLAVLLSGISAPVYGMLLGGESLYDHHLTQHGVILVGNESRGISEDLLPYVTDKLEIPAWGDTYAGKAESLNASVATAIVCAEFRRQCSRRSPPIEPQKPQIL